MKKLLPTLVYLFFLPVIVFCQKNTTHWQASIDPQKLFVENKGQFDGLDNLSGKRTLYATDGNAQVILFNKTGVSFRLEKRELAKEEEREEIEETVSELDDRPGAANYESHDKALRVTGLSLVSMQWEGANPDVKILPLEVSSTYFNYGLAGKAIDHAAGFKKLVYQNLYDKIDVEYVFHPVCGIEYTLILHPGADPSKIKMRYDGAHGLAISPVGEIHIPTVNGDIIDHVPVTFVGDDRKEIPSSFTLSGNEVSFNLGAYDISKTVRIDPWTATPTLPSSNKAFYIKSDSLGNAYVYGGTTPFTLIKYNTTGAVAWTYSTAWDTSNNWFGALAVDRAGNSYITSGSIAAIAKINTSGSQVWQNSPGGALNSTEYWSMDFNCDQSQLVVGGTDYNPASFLNGYVFNINMNTGAQLNKVLVATLAQDSVCVPIIGCITETDPNEARALCFSPNSNFYFITLDTIGSLTGGFGINFEDTQRYDFAYYNKYGYGTGQGHNGIRASLKYLYTSDGLTLEQRDLNTGAVIRVVSIPNGVAQMASGIAIDTCGYVYVGTQAAVVKYDENLNYQSTAATPGAVFDVSIGVNGDVLACGQSFAVALAMGACPQIRPICYQVFTARLNETSPLCFGVCDGTATATTTNGTGPYTYRWSNNATTQTINNLCAGTYTCTVTDQSNSSTAVATTTISAPGSMAASAIGYAPACNQSNGKVVTNVTTGGVSPFTYAWSAGGSTTQVDSNLAAGTYTVTITDTHNCTATASATISQNPDINLSTSSTQASCASNNGTATVTVTSGGTPPYIYNWSNGQHTNSITGLSAGTYTVTVSDTVSGSASFWGENWSGGGTTWTLNVAGTGTNGGANNKWIVNTDNTCDCGGGNNYLHITCNSGNLECSIGQSGTCTYLAYSPFGGSFATDVLAVSPLISTVGKYNMSLTFKYEVLGTAGTDYGRVALSSDGGTTWTALPTQYQNIGICTWTTVSIPSGYDNIANFKLAFEWINANGTFTNEGNPPGFSVDSVILSASTAASCPGIATVNVASSSGITATTSFTPATCGQNTGTATVTPSGTGPFNFAWSNSDTAQTIRNLAGGNYTVTVTGPGNCSITESVSVTTTANISLTPASIATTCGNNNGSATVSASGGGGTYTYAWNNSATTATINNLAAGSYTVTVIGGGCSATASASVGSSTGLSVTTTTTAAGCTPNGTATANVTGGTGGYLYEWSNSESGQTDNNLSGGIYTVTVTGGGCSATGSATVGTTGGGISLVTNATPASCGNNSGSATVTPTGGSNYSYAWSNSGTTATINNLGAGTYIVTVTGTGGCSATATVNVTASGGLSVTPAVLPTTCGNNNGSASVSVTGGSGNYNYVWSNNAVTSSINNLASGNYQVTVNDGAGCSATASVTINPSGAVGVVASPPTQTICSGDTARICATAGFASYTWNTGDTGSCINTVFTGNYYVTVTDNGGCSAVSNHVIISNYTPTPVTVSVNGDTLTSYTAVTYQWYLNGQAIPGATSATYVAQSSGSYKVEVTDVNGCHYSSSPVSVITGINDLNIPTKISVYPNPLTGGNWHVDVSEALVGSNCEVYDADGRVVYKGQLRSTQSEIEMNVAQGVYMLQIHSALVNYNVKLIKLY